MINKADIGLIGLAVMGQNLVLNMEEKGISVAVFNRTTEKVDLFMQESAKGKRIVGTHSIAEFIDKLKKPRLVMLMIKAGDAVDQFIEKLLPFLEKGDVIIDGGNSYYLDTIRRNKYLEEKGIYFIGTGISGGEEGARFGPSIMPGGSSKAWPLVKDIFQKIAAKTTNGFICCDWVGFGGAGHFVKMVHNGIEYGDMQIIAEAYHLMKNVLKLKSDRIGEIFAKWNKYELNSYLIEITANIFAFKDEDGQPLVEKIRDSAGQKGTGKWASTSALKFGSPLTLITDAVFARFLSAMKEERVQACKILKGPRVTFEGDIETFIENIQSALYVAKIISYAQGFMLMKKASNEYKWALDLGKIALLWREGCIIRSQFLDKIKSAYDKNPNLQNLLLDDFFSKEIENRQKGLRAVVSSAAQFGVSVPCLGAALFFYDSYRSSSLPANLIQAQRDYFGAHTYELLDKPIGNFYHTNWF